VHLFVATSELLEESDLGWKALIGDQLHVKSVDGTHHSIMRKPHVHQLSDAINRALEDVEESIKVARKSTYSPLTIIQIGEPDTPPLFCVPGAGANVACFISLAQALDKRVPIYGLQPRGVDGVSVPHSTVSAAARVYIDEILKVFPRGPYCLLGHSFGGWVAFEMACQLSTMGESVGSVTMLDTSPPSAAGIKQRQCNRIDTLMEWICILEQESGKNLGISEPQLRDLDEKSQLMRIHKEMVLADLLPQRSTLRTLQGAFRVFAANLNAGYMPKAQFSGKVILAQASERGTGASNSSGMDVTDSAGAWHKHASRLEVIKIPGNHMTLLNRPNIDLIARYI
jgi:thioesterase domain-containing protein